MSWYVYVLPVMYACARASATMITKLCRSQTEKANICAVEFNMFFLLYYYVAVSAVAQLHSSDSSLRLSSST